MAEEEDKSIEALQSILQGQLHDQGAAELQKAKSDDDEGKKKNGDDDDDYNESYMKKHMQRYMKKNPSYMKKMGGMPGLGM